jgi:hypothetical protein
MTKRRSRPGRRSRSDRHGNVPHGTATACQATVDDWERGGYHATRQRIHQPGTKACPRSCVEQVKHLCLCTTHARMAREGLIDETGRVANRADITNVRRYPKQFPRGLYHWAQES